MMKIISAILRFTTGLGFYGLGLLGLALAFWFLMSGQLWTNIGTGLFGAFVYKNYNSIVDWAMRFEWIRKLFGDE